MICLIDVFIIKLLVVVFINKELDELLLSSLLLRRILLFGCSLLFFSLICLMLGVIILESGFIVMEVLFLRFFFLFLYVYIFFWFVVSYRREIFVLRVY